MAFLTTLANAFGGRWFNEQWKPEFDRPEWKATLNFYVDLMKNYGPPGASSNGFNENLALFNSGQMRHVGRCHGRRLLRQRSQGVEGRRQGRLRAGPCKVTGKGANWLWAWSLGHSRRLAEGRGRREVHRLGDGQGISPSSWPPRKAGRMSRRAPANRSMPMPDYLKAAPFAAMTLNSIDTADPITGDPEARPYVGVQFAAIPEFQGIAHQRRPVLRCRPCRADTTVDEALAQRPSPDDAGHDEGRLYQIGPAPGPCCPASCRAAPQGFRSRHSGARRSGHGDPACKRIRRDCHRPSVWCCSCG